MKPKNPTIIVGHYGSGKTEFALNYALSTKKEGTESVVADLDIVNPFYRARELKEEFSKRGVQIVSSNMENELHLDMPALAAALQSCFTRREQRNIVDVGGDPVGAVALARYARFLEEGSYHMWMVVNANRPQTQTASDAVIYLKEIEKKSRLKMTGLVSNTHMLGETSMEDILKGNRLVHCISEMTGLPVVHTVVEANTMHAINLMLSAEKHLSPEEEAVRAACKSMFAIENIFPITRMLNTDWQ